MVYRIETIKDIDGNDVKVRGELADFYNAIKLKNPMLVARVTELRKTTTTDENGNRVKLFCNAKLVNPNKPDMELGNITFYDSKYIVNSRLIRNDKYAHWNKTDYHSKSSVHMKNMIKVALDNIVPLTFKEIVEHSNDRTGVYMDLHNIRREIGREIKTKIDSIDKDVWFDELLNMHDTGYIPKTPKFSELIKFASGNREKYAQDYKYTPSILFVYIDENGSVKTTDSQSQNVTEYPNINALSEDVLGKVMVLMVTPEQTFVRDVGKKDTNNKLWVLV